MGEYRRNSNSLVNWLFCAVLLLPFVTLAEEADSTTTAATTTTTAASEEVKPKGTVATSAQADPRAPRVLQRPEVKRASSPLVDAARNAKVAKKKGKSRVTIDNESVKKSTGRLTELKTEPPPIENPPDVDETSDAEAQKTAAEAKMQGEERIEKARKTVEEIEKELVRLEESYYDEDDPATRDGEIEQQFDDAREQLAKARADLSEARKGQLGAPNQKEPESGAEAETPPFQQ